MESKTVNINRLGEIVYITFPKLEKTGMLRHCFTTRLGGVSKGCFSSMNMSFSRGDSRENVKTNYERICGAVGISTANLVFTKQTHTDNCVIVTEQDRGRGFSKQGFEDVDGLITDRKGVALVTQFADCTPVILCDPVRSVIASVHSGWRGTVKQISAKAIGIMESRFGSERKDIIAAIGPCIGPCCYEVDDPVYSAFAAAGFDMPLIFKAKENGRYMLDLTLANKLILINAGIMPENIDASDICPCCNSDEMFSHRAQSDKRGNMAAIIELK